MQIPKSEKKILGPPLPSPGDAPVTVVFYNTFSRKYCLLIE